MTASRRLAYPAGTHASLPAASVAHTRRPVTPDGAELAVIGPGVPVEIEFGLDLLLDGLERRLAGT